MTPRISLLLEDSLATAALVIAIGLCLYPVMAIDDGTGPGRQRLYSASFLKFPERKPFKLSHPVRPKCDGVPFVGQRTDPFEPWQFECAPGADLTQRKEYPL